MDNPPIVSKIQGIAIPVHSKQETFCWGLDSLGKFSTRTAIWMAHDKDVNDFLEWPLKWIWQTYTMPKIKIFLRKICHKAISV